MTAYVPVEVYLNSRYASFYVNGTTYNSDMVFYFKTPVTRAIDYNFKLSLKNFTFPLSFYTIDSDNNKLYISGVLFTLTAGNYNATTFRTMLSTVLTGFTITYNSTTNKLTFTKATVCWCFSRKSSGPCQTTFYRYKTLRKLFSFQNLSLITVHRSDMVFRSAFAGDFPEILPDLSRPLFTVTKRYSSYFRSTTYH